MSELNGNPKEKGVVFTAGPRKISVDALKRATDAAVTGFIQNQNWKESEQQEFMKAYHNLMNGIDNGTIAERDLGRRLLDTTGMYTNEKDKFDAYGYAAGFINRYADALPEYKEEETKKILEKYNSKKSNRILEALNNTYYGGNFSASLSDFELWRDRDALNQDGTRPITKRAEALAKLVDAEIADVQSNEYDYEGSPYRDKNDLVERLTRLSTNLKDGNIDSSDFNDFIAVGIPSNVAKLLFENDLAKYYSEKSDKSKELTELQQKQKQLAELQAARKEEEDLAATNKAIEQELALQNFDDWYSKLNPGYDQVLFSRDNVDDYVEWYRQNTTKDNISNMWESILDNYYTYQKLLNESGVNTELLQQYEFDHPELLAEYIENPKNKNGYDTVYKEGINDAINKTLAGLKYFQPQIQNSLIDLGDGSFAIPALENYDEGTVGVWNPNNNELSVRSIKNIPQYADIVKNNYTNNTIPKRHLVNIDPDWYTRAMVWAKQLAGQVAKHQSGAEIARKWTPSVTNKPKQPVNTIDKETNVNINDGDGDADFVDFIPVALDLISAGAAFLPGYGTLISGGAGLVSSLTQFTQNGDVSQLIGNIGQDLIGMIPVFGSAAKAAKVYKGVKKVLPVLLKFAGYTAGGMGTLQDLGTITDKLNRNEELDGKDYTVLASSLLDLISTMPNLQKGIRKAARMKDVSRLKSKEEFFVKRAGTNELISKEEFEKIKKLEGKTVTDTNKAEIEALKLDTKEKGFGNNKSTKVTSTVHSTKTGNFEFREIPRFKENSWWGNPYHLNKFEKKYATLGASYNEKPNVDVTKWEFPSDKTPSNKNGGTVRYLRYLSKGGSNDDWKGTVMADRSKEYLNTDNSMANATNTNTWSSYYKMDKIKADSLNKYKGQSGHNLSISLNNVESFNDKNFETGLNALGYTNWNNAFHSTGANEFFGFDTKRFDYMGPSTYNRKQYYTWLKDQTIQTNDGIVKFDGTKWVHTPSTPVVNEPVVDPAVVAEQAKKAQQQKDIDRAIAATQVPDPNKSVSGGETPSDPSSITEKYSNQKFKPTFNNWAGIMGNLIGVGRLQGILRDNRRASEQYAKSIIPVNENFLHRNNPLFDPYSTRVGARNKGAAIINNFEASANANDNMREKLAREMMATNYISDVDMKSDDIVRQQIAANYEKQHEIDKYNLGVANRNEARNIAAIAAKRQIPAQLILTQRASIDAFLKDKEKALKEYQRDFGAYQLQENAKRAILNTKESPEAIAFEASKDAYKDWLKANPGGTWEQFTKSNPNHKQSYDNFQKLYNTNMSNVYNDYWNSRLWYAKSGGAVKAAKIRAKSKDSELFHKDIHQNIKNHIKLLNNLSNVTKRLILKAMDA